MNHLLNRRRALFDLALATMDTASTPHDIHHAAVRALEASFAAELGITSPGSDEVRLSSLMEKFRLAFPVVQPGLFGGDQS